MTKMNICRDALAAIGFSKKESSVFLALLGMGAATATNLSRKLEKPRTSVLLILESLLQRGLVTKTKVRGHYEWESIDLDGLEATANERLDEFVTSLPTLRDMVRQQELGKRFSVKLFSGTHGLLQAYRKLIELPRDTRIHYFEGVESVQHKMSLHGQGLIKWQDAFRSSGVIIEVLGSRESLREVKSGKGNLALVAHRNRRMVAYELPEELCHFPCDIAVLPSSVFFFMPKDMQAIAIESRDLAESFRMIFKGLTLVSQKVDINALIENLLTHN